MNVFENPDKIPLSQGWIEWIFKLKSTKDKVYAVQFIEGWKAGKILILGAIPLVASCLTGVFWGIFGDSVQSGFAVASFILAASGSKFKVLLHSYALIFGLGKDPFRLQECRYACTISHRK